jgi:hypothetical protein
VKNGAQLLDRLLKDVVSTDSETFEIQKFIPMLQERIRIKDPAIRQLLVRALRGALRTERFGAEDQRPAHGAGGLDNGAGRRAGHQHAALPARVPRGAVRDAQRAAARDPAAGQRSARRLPAGDHTSIRGELSACSSAVFFAMRVAGSSP